MQIIFIRIFRRFCNTEVSHSSRARFKRWILGRLLKPIIAMIIIFVFLIVGMIGIMFNTTYESRVIADSVAETVLIADNVSAFVLEAYAPSEELASDPEILTMKTESQIPVLEACVKLNPYLELLYIQDVTGMQTGRSSGTLADRSERWRFKQTVAHPDASYIEEQYNYLTYTKTES